MTGIGAQAKAFERLGIEHEITATSDLDKDAIVSYTTIHNSLTLAMVDNYTDYPTREKMADYLLKLNIGYDFKKDKPYDWHKLARKKANKIEKYYLATILSKQVGDISKVDELPKADLWTYSFPCQDISNAGLQKGFSKGSNTRSGLLWEVERLLKVSEEHNELPTYLLLENVKALAQKSFIKDFYKWLSFLESLGYKNYWQVLNAKDFEVPQNRERVFAISILKSKKQEFEFPKAVPLELRLKDVLESNVDEKYYLSDKIVDRFVKTDFTGNKNIVGTTIGNDNHRIGERDLVYQKNSVMGALNSTDYKQPKQILDGD